MSALRALAAVAAFAALGGLAGVVWEWVWTPPMGVVYSHAWEALNAIELQHEFSGTAWYVVIGSVAGLIGGVAIAWILDRTPLLALAAVVVGSVLAGWVMLRVGVALGPADPAALARSAADGTRMPDALSVTGPSPWCAVPVGALVGLLVVVFGVSPRRRSDAPDAGVENFPREVGPAR